MSDLLDDDTTSSPLQRRIGLSPAEVVARPVDWAGATQLGSRRSRNEDAWGQAGSVFAVADGMGGLANGDDAARRAIDVVTSDWVGALSPALEVVFRANRAVQDVAAAAAATAGSTITALRFLNGGTQILHVGDSRAYRVRNGKVEQLTVDHNLRTHLLAAGIAPRSTRTTGPLGALTSYLGMPDSELRAEIRSVQTRVGDRFVLCTDGVYRNFDSDEFAAQVSFGSPASIVRRLTDAGATDDATTIVIDVANPQTGKEPEQWR